MERCWFSLLLCSLQGQDCSVPSQEERWTEKLSSKQSVSIFCFFSRKQELSAGFFCWNVFREMGLFNFFLLVFVFWVF